MKTSVFFTNTDQWNHELARQAHAKSFESYEDMRRTPSSHEQKVQLSTIKWARGIPSELRPRALVIKFPRVANTLADAWCQPRLFNVLLLQLMMDDRESRQGFPFDVLQDLINIRAHFDSLYKRPNSDVWRSV